MAQRLPGAARVKQSGMDTPSDANPSALVIPELPAVDMHLVRPTDPVTARVVGNRRCTQSKAAGFTRHVDLDVSGTPLENAILPGQSFGVIPPGTDERDRPHKLRLYSVASPTGGEDGRGKVIATTVKRTIDEHWETGKLFLGVASNYLCDLQPGDEVQVTGPNGKRFLLPTDAHAWSYLFFATGTGIAPFRGMVTDLLRLGQPPTITLVLGAAYRTDLPYHDELLALAEQHPQLRYIQAVSRERGSGGPRYVQDALDSDREHLLAQLAGERSLIYLCGIAGMELGLFQKLARALPEATREQYLEVDGEAMGQIDAWERRMIHKQVKPTKRVFMEVY